MDPLASLSDEQCAAVRWVLTDIDDTLTDDGKLGADAYAAMWSLHNAGVGLVAVTGRPAGWCDAIARQWPVEAVVGENGALVYYERQGNLRRMYHPQAGGGRSQRQAARRLERLGKKIQRAVPGSRIAKDQFARMFDVAIDFAEEPPVLEREAVIRIAELCRLAGAEAKISSIHVNAWYGRYSKLEMARLYLQQEHGLDLCDATAGVAYVGDSPNDSPMFAAVPLSIGVANVRDFEKELNPPPRYITDGRGGKGFAEFARRVLLARASKPA